MPHIFSSFFSRQRVLLLLIAGPLCFAFLLPAASAVVVITDWEEGHISGLSAEAYYTGFNTNVRHNENAQLISVENLQVQETSDPEVKLFIGRATYKVSGVAWSNLAQDEAVSANTASGSQKWLYLYTCTSPTAGDWESSYYYVGWQEYQNVALKSAALGFDGYVGLYFNITAPGQSVDLSQLGVTIENVQFVSQIESMHVSAVEYLSVGQYDDVFIESGDSAQLSISEASKDSKPNLGSYADSTASTWIKNNPLGFFRGETTTPSLQQGKTDCSPVGSSILNNGLYLNLRPNIYTYRQAFTVKYAQLYIDVEKNTWDSSTPYFKANGPYGKSYMRTLGWHVDNVGIRSEVEVSVLLYSTCRIVQDAANPDDLQCPDPQLADMYWEDAITGDSEVNINVNDSPFQQALDAWWADNGVYVIIAIIIAAGIGCIYFLYFTLPGIKFRKRLFS